MNEYMEVYLAEAKELLDEMNESLLMLEKDIGNTGLLNSIFRAAHTIKGNSASMGFKQMENLTHGMEDLLQDIRDGRVEIDEKIIELLFVCHDFMESGLCTIMQTGNEEDIKIDGILGKLHLIIKEKHEKLKGSAANNFDKSMDCIDFTMDTHELDNLKSSLKAGLNAYLVKIALTEDCVFKSVRVWMWYKEMDAYLTVVKSIPERPVIEEINEKVPDFEGNEIRLLVVSRCDSHQLAGELGKLLDVRDICIEKFTYNDNMGKQIKLVMTKAVIPTSGSDGGNSRLEAVLCEEAVTDDLSTEIRQVGQGLNNNAVKSLESSFMRISAQKIDSLVDMLGELLIHYSLMEQEASERFDSNDRYMNSLHRMAKIIKGVQNISMSLRMVSLKNAFQKITRVGRDTAAELGKCAEITIIGEETEIDRDISDKLVDPLMHLVRNCVSHGIESGEERKKLHKPEKGHIYIRAYSKRGYVYIEVEDDGSGISIEKIRNKAMERKLIDKNKNYSTEEIIKLIFLPGFSTQETVNNISGRGVGMDVVVTGIKKVGGKIDIINTPGKGCNIILKIPLNLAVMNGTIVDIFGLRYIVPTLYIKQFVKPEASQWLKVKNRKTMIKIGDKVYRIIQIDKIFGVENALNEKDENLVVIIELEQKFMALPVRSVIGRQEIVAKPLDKEFGRFEFASGASILGDGKVSLILDVEAMCKVNDSLCRSDHSENYINLQKGI